jgi:hypothetical protein
MAFCSVYAGVCGIGKETVFEFIPPWKCIELETGFVEGEYIFCEMYANVVYLDRPKKLQVEIGTGWNHIIKGEVTVSAPSGNVEFRLDETELEVSTDVDGNFIGVVF